jgi:TonB-dependent receptor
MTSGPNNYIVRTYQLDFGGEHEYGALQLDYHAGIGRNNLVRGNGTGAYLTNRISNIGWILDRTQSDLYPRFIQTSGPDFTNPANYRPIANGLETRPNEDQQDIAQVRGNARYTLPTAVPLFLKTGVSWREQSSELRNDGRRWSYIGTTSLAADPAAVTFDSIKTGRRIPRWEATAIMKDHVPAVPADWREDLYFHEQLQYTGTRDLTEEVTAGYVMAQGRLGREGVLGRTGFLGGVRTERTDTKSNGYVRARFGSTAAQQVADPVGSAVRDYAGTRRHVTGSYTKSFPSIHLTHELTPNFKARASWSTSFGRAPLSSLLPNETLSTDGTSLTVNNPALLPQTATNWDASLDYYFEPVGNLSVGFFQKTIKDYIVSGIISGTIANGPDNGYNGEYQGLTRLTSANAGTAFVQGWELSYQQQLTFLPGLLRGLAVSANYTLLTTHGDFGGAVTRSTNQVGGFIPRTANASLSWRHRGFGTRVLVNYTGPHLQTYSAASLGRNLYRFERIITTLGFSYQLRPAVTLTCDIDNLFNESQRRYRGISDQMQSTSLTASTVSFGLTGRF